MPTALITGATSGIGAAFARALAARGDDLVLVARDTGRLSESAARLSEVYAIEVETIRADLSVREDVLKVAARLEDAERPVDLLVNNAGFGLHRKLLDPDFSLHEYALEVMCVAVLILGGAAGRAMRSRGHGQIINVSSLAAWLTQGNYSAVKAWVRTYSESLAGELHGTGVTVTALCPGWVRTEFHERAGIRTSALPDWVWTDVDRCVAEALADAEKGRVISVPTKRWKAARAVADLMPRSAIHWASRKLTRSRD